MIPVNPMSAIEFTLEEGVPLPLEPGLVPVPLVAAAGLAAPEFSGLDIPVDARLGDEADAGGELEEVQEPGAGEVAFGGRKQKALPATPHGVDDDGFPMGSSFNPRKRSPQSKGTAPMPVAHSSRSPMRIVLTILVLGSLAGASGVALRAYGDQTGRPLPLTTPAAVEPRIAANGTVEGARPEVAIRPEIVGTLAAVHVREGQVVAEGTVLLELRNDSQRHQVALAKAEVDLAKAQLERLRNGEQPEKRRALAAVAHSKQTLYEQAKSEADRSQQLVGRGSTSREAADRDRFRMLQAKADWEQAVAEHALIEAPARADEVAAAEARVAAAEARLRLAEAELAKTRLVAPTAGRVLQRYAEPGEMAGPNSAQPVLQLADLSKRRVRAFVEELDAVRVRPGQKAVVTADGLPGKELRGTVALALPRMGRRAPQSDAPGEYKDLYYREVLIDLDEAADLPISLRVQVLIDVESKPSEQTARR
jgi:multidrug resistance efflux pump